uniref:very-long-chain enoyl-CoA reductase-like n=1 Tax=Myxine glutinosa TaxID=7769 RepID=UPI00358FFAF3
MSDRGRRGVKGSTTFEVEVLDGETREKLCFLDKVDPTLTVGELKAMFHKLYPGMYPARQSLRVDPGGQAVRDGDVLQHLPVGTTAIFYLYDLGPQINWSTALLCRYTLSLALYYLCYTRPPFVYGSEQAFSASPHRPVHLACVCYTFHYAKCILETVYIHNVSRGTFPLRQAVRTCACYGAFTLWMAFYVNHPLYTPPSYKQTIIYLLLFIVCEAGNYFVLVYLRDIRMAGHKETVFPVAGPNPFTWPFAFISCPNYTYEAGVWMCFTGMTHTLSVAVFAGYTLMKLMVKAREKHRSYCRDYPGYPTMRKPFFPFLA